MKKYKSYARTKTTKGKLHLLEHCCNNPYSHEDIQCSYSIHGILKFCSVKKRVIAFLPTFAEKKKKEL